MKKGFTIIELLVAMALLGILIAISGLVFATAVRAFRTASASTEIAAKLQVITQQLDDDFRGLCREGEFLLAWGPWPELEKDNPVLTDVDENADGIPDRYVSFDRLLFFANGDFYTYNQQPTISGGAKMIRSNLARICYSFGRDSQDVRASMQPQPDKRLLCRTQHCITADAEMPVFPDVSAWDAAKAANFSSANFLYEYQTISIREWFDLGTAIKADMLTSILDMTFSPSALPPNGPQVIPNNPNTLHQLFIQNIGQFHVQIWRTDLIPNRWYPEIDPDGDGQYGDSDYYVTGGVLETNSLGGIWNINDDVSDITIYYPTASGQMPLTISFPKAFKFTFTLYDSSGVFKDGKTFTHVVYLND